VSNNALLTLAVPNTRSHMYMKLVFTDTKAHQSRPGVFHLLYSWQTVVNVPPSFVLDGNYLPIKPVYNANDLQGGPLPLTFDAIKSPFGNPLGDHNLTVVSSTTNDTVVNPDEYDITKNGVYTITASVADRALPPNTATQTTTVTVDTSPPQITTVSTPYVSATTLQPTIQVSALDVALDGYSSNISTSSAQMMVDGQLRDAILADNGNGNYSVTPKAPLSVGKHHFKVVLYDNAGNPSTGGSGKAILGPPACKVLSKQIKRAKTAMVKTQRQLNRLKARVRHTPRRAKAARKRLFLKAVKLNTRLVHQRADYQKLSAGC
jgi:hypothetical protein